MNTPILPAQKVCLTDDDVKRLKLALKASTTASSVKRSCRILLALNQKGATTRSVAEVLLVSRVSISRATSRFRSGGMDAVLGDRTKVGRPPLPQAKLEVIQRMGAMKPRPSVREIARVANASVGVVSKALREQAAEVK